MFAIFIEGGSWLTHADAAENAFHYAPCKWLALQMPRSVAVEVLRRVRRHGVGAWIVPVEALHLEDNGDKMTRSAIVAVNQLAQDLASLPAYGLQHKTTAFKAQAVAALRWLLAQDAGGVAALAFPFDNKTPVQQQACQWAGAVLLDLQTKRRDFVEAVGVFLACAKLAGADSLLQAEGVKA